jgi:non-specific protein-tyrosine kinase
VSKLRKALEKAKEVRGAESQDVVRIQKPSGPGFRQRARTQAEERYPVSVTYCKTKVLDVNPQMLKNNKIVSLFDDNPVTDQIKSLRAQVLKNLKENGGNSLLVTSANAGEGKTFTAINLGVSIAQELDRTVLLVDADLRNPTFKHYDFAEDFFGVEVRRGLADYLTDSLEIPDLLLNPGIEKLTILPGGRVLPNSSELLGSSRMEALVRELKGRYRKDRVIIFDSPALLVCTDPLVLSNFVDGVLLVVEEERTTDNDLRRVMELLKDKPVLGTVLNKSKG